MYYLLILNKYLFMIGLVIDLISVLINEGKILRGGMKFYGEIYLYYFIK